MLRLTPEKFWAFSEALFQKQTDFYDAKLTNESRHHTYARLAKIASAAGVDESEVMKLLHVPDPPDEDPSIETSVSFPRWKFCHL